MSASIKWKHLDEAARRRARDLRSDQETTFLHCLWYAHADGIEVINAAAGEIWHSMRKNAGDPTQCNTHPINCGCTYCN